MDLIEEDWIHCGFSFKKIEIWMLFLDSTWQILIQDPNSFEFQEEFLWMIFDATLDGEISTISSATALNENYIPCEKNLMINAGSKYIRFCTALYAPWERIFQ